MNFPLVKITWLDATDIETGWLSLQEIKDKTLVAASSLEKDIRKINKTKKSDLSFFVGETLAKRANKKNITKVYFDRGCYKYHGRVKLLTEALRKHGLEF